MTAWISTFGGFGLAAVTMGAVAINPLVGLTAGALSLFIRYGAGRMHFTQTHATRRAEVQPAVDGAVALIQRQ